MRKTPLALALAVAALGFIPAAHATNGMNLEGYGPIATGMGGASFAYDNGNAAMMNNPATLGLAADGTSRLDVALGMLGPDVTSKMAGMPNANSDGTAYFMPAVGWTKRNGAWTYGIGMFGQGGMGTEYGANSLVSGYQSLLFASSGGLGGTQGASGQEARSELGVGRVIFPVSYNVNQNLTVGGSLDFVWGGLDLKMPMSGAMFLDMMPGSTNVLGAINGATSTMLGTLAGMMDTAIGGTCAAPAPACIQDVNYAAFNFSNGNDFAQKTRGTGWAGKLGVVWKATPALTLGATYHSKTSLGDFEGSGTLSMNVDMNTPGGGLSGAPVTIPVTGRLSVVDFQWPETYGLGMAYQANDRWLVAMDYKRINWRDVMKNFHMKFVSDNSAGNIANGLNNQVFEANLFQNWDDQDVFELGVSYKYSNSLTMRAGLNLANNPIPAGNMNPLFPATIKNHYTLGLGYAFDKASEVNFSLTYAPNVSVTNPNIGVRTDHSQLNWQLMYTKLF
jgi:long-chain fatty acid transport protein